MSSHREQSLKITNEHSQIEGRSTEAYSRASWHLAARTYHARPANARARIDSLTQTLRKRLRQKLVLGPRPQRTCGDDVCSFPHGSAKGSVTKATQTSQRSAPGKTRRPPRKTCRRPRTCPRSKEPRLGDSHLPLTSRPCRPVRLRAGPGAAQPASLARRYRIGARQSVSRWSGPRVR